MFAVRLYNYTYISLGDLNQEIGQISLHLGMKVYLRLLKQKRCCNWSNKSLDQDWHKLGCANPPRLEGLPPLRNAGLQS